MESDKSTVEMAALLDGNGSPKSSLEEWRTSDFESVDGAGTIRHRLWKTSKEESLESYYEPVASYEGRHRYDPHFQWSAAEEKIVVRRIDWRIFAFVCLMFFALQVDRGNIAQALSDDMLDDLGLTNNEFNTGQTIYLLSFIIAELPSQLISKRLGPDIWIPVQMVTWSIIASMQALLVGRWSFWITRGLVGLCEGGFIPTVVLYLSYFYNSAELPVRLSYFWVTKESSNMISALLAYGILHMRGIYGIEGWRWLFGLEGILTCFIGAISFLYLPPSPTQTTSRFRGQWFTVAQEKIMVNRILRDDPSKGKMHNREALTLKMFWRCLTDYHMLPIYLIGLSWELPKSPIAQYMTLNLRAAGFSTFDVNLLTIPAYLIWIVGLLFWTRVSEHINERFLLSTVSQFWVLPLLLALELLPTDRSHWDTWVLTVLMFAQPYVHAILVALASRNAGSVRTRAVSAALYNMSIQASNIIGANIYREDDAPFYFRGNKILIGVACYNLVLFVWTKWFYVSVNRKRDRIWNKMTVEDKELYLAQTTAEGNKRLDFRFQH